jgi:hypothetical protein
MAKNGEVSEECLKTQWLDAYENLARLIDFHVWPVDKDIAELEDELLRKLDTIERQLSQHYTDQV